jgi:hypothetical protein
MNNLLIELSSVDNISEESALEIVKKNRKSEKKFTLNNKVNIINFLNINKKETLENLIAPKYKYAFILLDTNNIDLNYSNDFKYGWRIIKSNILEQGAINLNYDIGNIVGMRIYPITTQFVTPITEANKTYITKSPNLNNLFTILIHEFQGQSYINEKNKYHFLLFPQLMNKINDPYIRTIPSIPYYELVTSGKMNGYFWFKTPITHLSTLTISMYNPYEAIKLNQNIRTLIPLQLIYL